MNIPIYFSLAPFVYAAQCEESAIIILDAKHDQYHSLIDDAAWYFTNILEESFKQHDGKHMINHQNQEDDKDWDYWIHEFLKQQFIVSCHSPSSKKVACMPVKPGGLSDYQWDSKPLWKPFSRAKIKDIMSAFFKLAQIHRVMKRYGIQGILEHIKKNNVSENKRIPSQEEVNRLAAAVDAASILYPKKTFCLAWATTFVLCALKKGWDCALVIGVQTTPFYAHAWASCNGNVIHDDPIIADVLSLILQEPFSPSDTL